MPTEQIAVRLPSEQLSFLDELVQEGVYDTRAAAVRAGIAALAIARRSEAEDRAIVESYRRVPPSEGDHAAAVASLREAIVEEPW